LRPRPPLAEPAESSGDALGRMKRVALGLLCGAALLYAVASALQAQHPAWGYVAAFSEAAMVGAIADWFAVVALFRHPLGLPIPHTAIIPSNKDRIGAKLAGFICNNFLGTEQVLAKLRGFDAAGRLAAWLARPESAGKLGEWGVLVARYALGAFDDARVRDFLGRIATAGHSLKAYPTPWTVRMKRGSLPSSPSFRRIRATCESTTRPPA